MSFGNEATERSSLLSTEHHHVLVTPTSRSSWFQIPGHRVVIICFMLRLIIDGGAYLQLAPRAQLIEYIICRQHYSSYSEFGDGDPCKRRAVQSKLALLYGMQQLFDVLPNILLAVPYSIMANKYGRKRVLMLAILGLCLGFAWVQVVCWFSDVLPIRLIWLSPAFSIIGGGTSVANSMVYALIAGVTPEKSRVHIFFGLEASKLVSVTLSLSFSSLLMERNLWIPMLLGIGMMFFGNTLVLFIPDIKETFTPPVEPSHSPIIVTEESLSHEAAAVPTTDSWTSKIGSMRENLATISHNRSAIVLLVLSLLNSLGAGVHEMMLIFFSKRFNLSFSKATLFLSLDAFVKLFVLVILFPVAGYLVLKHRRITAYTKDVYLLRVCGITLVLGTLGLGVSSVSSLAAIATGLFATGFGIHALTRSLITDVISRNNISVVYTVMTVLQTIGECVAGPLYSTLFSVGLNSGYFGIGLPFIVSGCIFMIGTTMIWTTLSTHGRNEDNATAEQPCL